MKFHAIVCSFIFLSCTVNAQMHIEGEGFIRSNMSYSIDFEVDIWDDSTDMKFLVVTVEKSVPFDLNGPSNPRVLDLNDYPYWNLSAFSILENGSMISPVRYKNSVNFDNLNSNQSYIMQGLFLVNDVHAKSDSVELILNTHWGYMLQSSAYFSTQSVMLHFDLTNEIDSQIPRATKRWYRKTLKHDSTISRNPQRIIKQ